MPNAIDKFFFCDRGYFNHERQCKFIPVCWQFSLVTHREVEDLTTGKGNCIALKKAYQFKITEDNQRRNFRQIFPYFKLRLNQQSFEGTHKLFQYFKTKFGSK